MNSMKKGRKILIILLCSLLGAGAVAGIAAAVVSTTGSAVLVVQAANFNYGGGWYSGGDSVSGVMTTNAEQTIYLTDAEEVAEVFVTEGQAVHEGDILFTYDTKRTSMNLEKAKIARERIQMEIEICEQNIKTLNSISPVSYDDFGIPGDFAFFEPEEETIDYGSMPSYTVLDENSTPRNASGSSSTGTDIGGQILTPLGSEDSPYIFLAGGDEVTLTEAFIAKWQKTAADAGLTQLFIAVERRDEQGVLQKAWISDIMKLDPKTAITLDMTTGETSYAKMDDPEKLAALLSDKDPEILAQVLQKLDPDDLTVAAGMLDAQTLGAVLEQLEGEQLTAVLRSLSEEQQKEILAFLQEEEERRQREEEEQQGGSSQGGDQQGGSSEGGNGQQGGESQGGSGQGGDNQGEGQQGGTESGGENQGGSSEGGNDQQGSGSGQQEGGSGQQEGGENSGGGSGQSSGEEQGGQNNNEEGGTGDSQTPPEEEQPNPGSGDESIQGSIDKWFYPVAASTSVSAKKGTASKISPEKGQAPCSAGLNAGSGIGASTGLIDKDAVYTAEELERAKKEQQTRLKALQLDLRESDLKIAQAQKAVDEGSARASMNGVIKFVGDPENPPVDGSPFVRLTSAEGLFVKSAIRENKLGTIKEGDVVYVRSWQNGMNYEAEIRYISPYPDETGMFSQAAGESYYPFTAYISDTNADLHNDEWVEVSFGSSSGIDVEGIGTLVGGGLDLTDGLPEVSEGETEEEPVAEEETEAETMTEDEAEEEPSAGEEITEEPSDMTGNLFEDGESSSFYLWKAFIREENDQYYVFMEDERGLLKKQYVEVGTVSGESYEILSGLKGSDWIAFPYGKNVREGAKVREGTPDELYN